MGRSELPYIINKLSNLRLSEEELKNLSYQERCNLLSLIMYLITQYLLLGIFNIKLKHFSKRSYLMVHWAKRNIMPYVLNFKKGAAHMSIRSYEFSMHQIFLNEADYIEFIERTINAQLSDHSNNPELFELVKTYQVYAHSRTCWK